MLVGAVLTALVIYSLSWRGGVTAYRVVLIGIGSASASGSPRPLAQQTDLLLLDEPTTFLDINHQVEVLDLLTDLVRHNGRTVIIVLHDLNLACGYAGILNDVHRSNT